MVGLTHTLREDHESVKEYTEKRVAFSAVE